MKRDKDPSENDGELRRRAEKRLQAGRKEAADPTGVDTQRLLHELQVYQIELEMQNEELRQSREQLEAGLERFTDLYDFAPVGYLALDSDGAILQANLTGASLLGVERSLLLGRHFGSFVAEPNRTGFKSFLEKVFENQAKETCDVALLREGKKPLYLRISSLLSQDGRECRLTLTDITEQKRSEEALRESEESFRLGFENANIGMCLVDTAGNFIRVNRQMCEIFGYSRAELEAMTVDGITHPDYANGNQAFIRRAKNREVEHTEFEKIYIHKQGHPVWGHVSSSLVRNAAGDPMYFISHVVDITTRKKTELELRQSEERYRVLVEVSSEAMLLRDEQGKIVYANPSALGLFHVSKKEDLLGLDYLGLVHPDDREESARRILRSIKEKIPSPWREHRLLTLDGQVIYVESTGVPLEEGGQKHVLGVFHDLTERKRLEDEHKKMEAQVRQAQKMEAVGRLAGGVAHDFNNMLGVIMGFSDLAIAKLPADHAVQEYLSEVKSAAQRSVDITRQLLAFARRQAVSPKILDLNDIIEGMLRMLRRLIGEDIDLLWKPAQNLWPVKIDPSQVDQILANLIVNARDAIAGVGKIIIATESQEFDDHFCKSHEGFVPGSYSILAVSDNGCGMDKEALEKLFEPFFTTKKQGEGTGLGLATVYGIVKQNSGVIDVHSEPGHGTTVKIYLPRQDAGPEEIKHVGGPAEAQTGTETVLLVEDEESLLKFAKILMEGLGYSVLAASSAQAAIQLSRGYAGEIHLLMTDVVMPEMNGRDLGLQIETLRPGIKCLFMSGYTANVIAHHGVIDAGVQFLQKPFSRGALARKLREALA